MPSQKKSQEKVETPLCGLPQSLKAGMYSGSRHYSMLESSTHPYEAGEFVCDVFGRVKGQCQAECVKILSYFYIYNATEEQSF